MPSSAADPRGGFGCQAVDLCHIDVAARPNENDQSIGMRPKPFAGAGNDYDGVYA
jgi:hypothetical protein